jgi:hypothetical protein
MKSLINRNPSPTSVPREARSVSSVSIVKTVPRAKTVPPLRGSATALLQNGTTTERNLAEAPSHFNFSFSAFQFFSFFPSAASLRSAKVPPRS